MPTSPPTTVAGATATVPFRDLIAALAIVSAVIVRKNPPPYNAAPVDSDPDGNLTITGGHPAAAVSIRPA